MREIVWLVVLDYLEFMIICLFSLQIFDVCSFQYDWFLLYKPSLSSIVGEFYKNYELIWNIGFTVCLVINQIRAVRSSIVSYLLLGLRFVNQYPECNMTSILRVHKDDIIGLWSSQLNRPYWVSYLMFVVRFKCLAFSLYKAN